MYFRNRSVNFPIVDAVYLIQNFTDELQINENYCEIYLNVTQCRKLRINEKLPGQVL